MGLDHGLVRARDGGDRRAPTRTCAGSSRSTNGLVRQDGRQVGQRGAARATGCPASPPATELGCYALTEPGAGSDPGGARDARRARRRRLGVERLEDLHHARLVGRASRSSSRAPASEGPRGITCFLVPTDRGRLQRAADQGQARPARAGHGRALPRRRARPRREPARRRAARASRSRCRRSTTAGSRSRAGCVGIAQGCLDASIAVREGAAAVRAADRELPARAGAARRHRRRDGGRAAARVARGRDSPTAAKRHTRRSVVREVLRERGRRARGERRRAGARRLRLRRRVPGAASTCATRA